MHVIYPSLENFKMKNILPCNKFFVGLHGDKTHNTFCLWKHHVNLLLQIFRSVSPDLHIISTDEDPGLRIKRFTVINLRGVSTNKKYCYITMYMSKYTYVGPPPPSPYPYSNILTLVRPLSLRFFTVLTILIKKRTDKTYISRDTALPCIDMLLFNNNLVLVISYLICSEISHFSSMSKTIKHPIKYITQ
jgi:hypothetical protein